METYLGICMVVVVTGIVLGVLARLITGGILDEIERVKKQKFDNRCMSIAKMIKSSSKYIEDYMKNVKQAVEYDKEFGKYGSRGTEIAKEAFEKTAKEMKSDFDL